jgi:DNA-binding PadR family transcriptional regulator
VTEINEELNKLQLEMRRGIVVLAVLSQLETPQYGYSLVQTLADLGMEIEEGTLYPLLRRLAKQGLLESDWEIGESRPRKYYRISVAGREVYQALVADWNQTVRVMTDILKGHEDE